MYFMHKCRPRAVSAPGRAGSRRVCQVTAREMVTLRSVQGPRQANQVLGEVGIDLPRACGIRIGQRIARNRLATKPHVVQPTSLSPQIDLDLTQGFAVGQLGECHGEELIQTRAVLDLVLSIVISHTVTKRAQRQIEHELRENELALVHEGFGRKSAKNSKSDFRRSNRDQNETPNSTNKSLTYDVLRLKRWDTTDFLCERKLHLLTYHQI